MCGTLSCWPVAYRLWSNKSAKVQENEWKINTLLFFSLLYASCDMKESNIQVVLFRWLSTWLWLSLAHSPQPWALDRITANSRNSSLPLVLTFLKLSRSLALNHYVTSHLSRNLRSLVTAGFTPQASQVGQLTKVLHYSTSWYLIH